jgi:hypothetical protein
VHPFCLNHVAKNTFNYKLERPARVARWQITTHYSKVAGLNTFADTGREKRVKICNKVECMSQEDVAVIV